MALFSREPELQDQALGELGQMFASPELVSGDPTPGAELLDASRLDFTLESLGFVDDYLDQMRRRQLDDMAHSKLVLRCGAYVGEVILRNAKHKTYHWVDYKGALKINRSIADFGMNLGTAAVLWDSADGLAFPLAKVQKFLASGRENSVQIFANMMIEQSE
ncbi:MAG TPA: hypothetical protein VGX68_19370 [Thermoanaerobaculia bacterium]|jgi:hypothetical protein|nr:hypothetical protein [Thermoanaerobaculia bacterium]